MLIKAPSTLGTLCGAEIVPKRRFRGGPESAVDFVSVGCVNDGVLAVDADDDGPR